MRSWTLVVECDAQRNFASGSRIMSGDPANGLNEAGQQQGNLWRLHLGRKASMELAAQLLQVSDLTAARFQPLVPTVHVYGQHPSLP